MDKLQDILGKNLTETLRQLQRYMVLGLGTAVFALMLAASQPAFLDSSDTVELPSQFLPLPVSLRIGIVFALAAYWVAGFLAVMMLSRTKQIIKLLDDSPELVKALLTYPSIPTINYFLPRMFLAVAPAIIILVVGMMTDLRILNVGCLLLLVSPYIVLTYQLRKTISDIN